MIDPKELQTATTLKDILPCHRFRYELAAIHLAHRLPPGSRVLDFACGNGYGTYMLAIRMPDKIVVGADRNEEALDIAREHYSLPNTCYKRAVWDGSHPEAFAPQLKDARRFEAIVSFETIEHLGEDQRFLDVLADLLIPEGHLVASVPSKNLKVEDFRYHIRHYDTYELGGKLIEAGFQKMFVRGQVGMNFLDPSLAHHLIYVARKGTLGHGDREEKTEEAAR